MPRILYPSEFIVLWMVSCETVQLLAKPTRLLSSHESDIYRGPSAVTVARSAIVLYGLGMVSHWS